MRRLLSLVIAIVSLRSGASHSLAVSQVLLQRGVPDPVSPSLATNIRTAGEPSHVDVSRAVASHQKKSRAVLSLSPCVLAQLQRLS